MEYPDLNEVERRSKRYWTVDGIPEIVMGGIWILWGAAFLVPEFLARDSRFARGYSGFVWVILLASAFAANWIMKTLKNKYTFPRAGYVQFNEPRRSQRILTVLMGGLIAAALVPLFAISVKHQVIADVAAPAIGTLMAGGFLIASRRQGMPHWIWLSLISLILGAALYPLKLAWVALPWYFIGMGVAFALAGSCRFRAFVRSIPLPGGSES